MSDTPLILLRHLLVWAINRPDHPAYVDPDLIATSWRELATNVHRIAAEIRKFTNQTVPRIAVWQPNSRLWIESLLAIHSVGGIDVPLDARLSKKHAVELATKSGCQWLLTAADQLVAIDLRHDKTCVLSLAPTASLTTQEIKSWDKSVAQISPWQTASIQWTSGTTGNPKGVMLSHYNLTSNAIAKWQAVPQSASDVRLTMLSLAHAYARTSDLGTWLVAGSTLCAVEGSDAFFDAAKSVRPHLVNTVPYIIHQALRMEDHGSVREAMGGRLRWLGCGGAALSPHIFEQLSQDGLAIIQGYGLTEASPVICSATPNNGQPSCVGQCVPGVTVIVDELGEILCRGPGVMQGYLDDPLATAERIQAGWLRTGDLGAFDSNGQLRVLGRADEVIVLDTGYKVHPSILEQRLVAAEEIEQAFVTQDAEQHLVAYVFPSQTHFTEQRLLEVCHECLGDRFAHEQIRRVYKLSKRLSEADNELTMKGTIKRSIVAKLFNG